MFFYIYLKEIKFRLIYSFITFFVTLICLYFYSNILLEFLISNILKIKNNSLIFISITESFFAHLNFSFKFSFIITLFIFLLHVWLFIKPSLYCYENFYCKIFGFIFIISLLIANYIVLVYLLPIFFSFFLNFENANYISYQGRVSEYLLFIYNILLNVNILFQLPLVITLLYSFNLINSSFLIKYRKFILFLLLIIVIFISPAELITQFFLFLIIIISYEIVTLLFLILDSYSILKMPK